MSQIASPIAAPTNERAPRVTFAPASRPVMSSPPDNPGEFDRLYRHTVGPLRRFLRRMLRDEAEAEDIAHDAYLRVFPSVQQETVQNPAALLYTTARRLAINRIKRRAHAPISREAAWIETSAAPQPGVVQQVIARQELARVEAAIAGLPEGCRAVLLLRKVELLSHREIADRLGIAVSTVEKQHARALRLLRVRLAEGPENLPATPNPEGAP